MEMEANKNNEDLNSSQKAMVKSLDLDFLFYLQQLVDCKQNVCLESEKDLVEVWCDKLLGEVRKSIANRMRRNLFLSQLILSIKEGTISLSPVFSKQPLPLSSYPQSIFGLSPSQTAHSVKIEKKNTADLSEVAKMSDDRKCYLATKSLPKGAGFMAYIGITTGTSPQWLDSQGKPFFDESLDDNNERGCPKHNFEFSQKWAPYQNKPGNDSIKMDGGGGKMTSHADRPGKRQTLRDDLLAKVEKSLREMEKTHCIPINQDENLLCVLDKLQKKISVKKKQKLSLLPATQRYYEMLKLIRKSILHKRAGGSSKCPQT